jgi:hypothetical protein
MQQPQQQYVVPPGTTINELLHTIKILEKQLNKN